MTSLKKWVAGIKEKASAHDAEVTAQRTAGQSVKQNWVCSQVENEEEEEEEDWSKENQMEVQWDEDTKMKKRSKAGEKGTRWQHSGMKSNNWRRFWNEEGWKDAPCS